MVVRNFLAASWVAASTRVEACASIIFASHSLIYLIAKRRPSQHLEQQLINNNNSHRELEPLSGLMSETEFTKESRSHPDLSFALPAK